MKSPGTGTHFFAPYTLYVRQKTASEREIRIEQDRFIAQHIRLMISAHCIMLSRSLPIIPYQLGWYDYITSLLALSIR